MTPHHSPAPFTRRQGLLAAGLAGAGAALGVPTLTPSATAAPHHRDRGRPIRPGDTAHVAVTVATSWVDPGQNRPGLDDPAIGRPMDPVAWNRNLDTTEERRWLVGNLETQAVLGSEVIVDEIHGDWAHVVVTHQGTPRDDRGYPGWVHVPQLVVDPAFGADAAARPTAVVTATRSQLTATPSGRHPGIPVSFNTELPVLGRAGAAVKVSVPGQARAAYLPSTDVLIRPAGTAPWVGTAEEFIATAERFLGLRYLWAGVSAYGFDCSGFTFTAARHHGIAIDRDAGPQRNHSGLAEVARDDLQRGDLIFFFSSPTSTSIRHVAIWLGDDDAGADTILQAPNSARSVEKVSLAAYDVNNEYAGARRLPFAS